MPKKVSLIIDTNWWISLILSKYKTPLVYLFKTEEFVIFRCKELSDEIFATLQKEKFKKIVNEEIVNNFFRQYYFITNTIIISSEVKVCRDPKDDYLLAFAKDAKADFLITGDNDLLELQEFEGTKIVTLPRFLEYINTYL